MSYALQCIEFDSPQFNKPSDRWQPLLNCLGCFSWGSSSKTGLQVKCSDNLGYVEFPWRNLLALYWNAFWLSLECWFFFFLCVNRLSKVIVMGHLLAGSVWSPNPMCSFAIILSFCRMVSSKQHVYPRELSLRCQPCQSSSYESNLILTMLYYNRTPVEVADDIHISDWIHNNNCTWFTVNTR